jgi:hypothetical protein
LGRVPWQIRLVVAVLALEGVGNLLSIPSQPVAIVWLAAKCLFIIGLLRRCKWVFLFYMAVGMWHVLTFGLHAPLIALVLVASSFRHYFTRPQALD